MPEELVNITINHIELKVPKGELVIESAKRIGVEIPVFCYHNRLHPVGMCRMCLVEVGTKMPDGQLRMMPKPQASCTMPATDNLVIFTDTEQIHKDRKAVVEFLLLNHPLDCPICDRGGECPLQNNTLFYGTGESRMIEQKRKSDKAYPISEYVVLDRERCIHCARCTRFTEEISGDGQLAFLFRGAGMKISTFNETKFSSKFSGNTIEICPVGALTNRKYRFRARPWDLQTQKTICSKCSNGCNIHADYRDETLIRVNGRTNDEVNDEWTCDKGKFGNFYVNENRLQQPLIRESGELKPASWQKAYELIIDKFQNALSSGNPNTVAGLGGERTTNEDNWFFQKLFREGFGSNNIDHRMDRVPDSALIQLAKRLGAPAMQNSIKSIENAKTILILGSNLIDEQPIIYLRTRKAWFKNQAKVITAYPENVESSAFSELTLQYKSGSEKALVMGLLKAVSADKPIPEDIQIPEKANLECASEQTGISIETLKQTAELINAKDTVILCGDLIRNHAQAEDIINALIDLTILTGNDKAEHGGLNLPLAECNSHGALDMGLTPFWLPGYQLIPPEDRGLGTQGILKGLVNGSVKCLYLMGCNPINRYWDKELAENALKAADFVVVQDIHESNLLEYADVVLPAQAFIERNGTWTNTDGRVQRINKALPLYPNTKADWDILAELLYRRKQALGERNAIPPFSPKEIMDDIAGAMRIFSMCKYDNIGDNGLRPNRDLRLKEFA